MKAITLLFSLLAASSLHAQLLVPEKTKTRIAVYGWIEAGVTGNPGTPDDNQNFGRLFDDRSNEPVVNQLALTAERALETNSKFDWGFKLQLMIGTDGRYIHSLGLFDRVMGDNLYQPDISEAYLSLRLAWLDVKLGSFVTLEGIETIDPRTNLFYSHTYIFNFGIPLNHAGALFTAHANKWLDVTLGATRGVNTSIEDNNDAPAFHGGVSLNLNDGKFLVAASTHIGPETVNNNEDLRFLNDAAATWKISERLTSITELNYTHDNAADADAYGVAQYFTYAINKVITAKIRGEIWRDAEGFYAAQFASTDDAIRALGGEAVTDPRTVGGGRTTYGALTIGLDIKAPMPKPFLGLTIRPEVRVDHSFSETRPFNDSRDETMFTAAVDVIVTF